MTDATFRYATTDATIIHAFVEWQEQRRAWGLRITSIAKKYGRRPVESILVGECSFACLTRKKDESLDPRAYKGTMWVLTEQGWLRPRANHPDGKKLLKLMHDAGRTAHPSVHLRGIPKMYGFLGRPGMFLAKDGKTLVATYGEKVKHDHRWTPIKESEYWRLHEEREGSEREVLA